MEICSASNGYCSKRFCGACPFRGSAALHQGTECVSGGRVSFLRWQWGGSCGCLCHRRCLFLGCSHPFFLLIGVTSHA